MHLHDHRRPRVGVPWRTVRDERSGHRKAYELYLTAVREAEGDPVEVPLLLPPPELARLAGTLDAILLTGSPADVDPACYGQTRHPETADPDPDRECTDRLLLDRAFAAGKPVLAVCYGVQMLNVYLGGTLVQDISAELGSAVVHDHEDGEPDALHAARVEGGRLREWVGADEMRVNSSHHQAIRDPGRGLRITARAPDGVIEAVELARTPAWVVGVQWHPERMPGDALAGELFRRLMAAARQ